MDRIFDSVMTILGLARSGSKTTFTTVSLSDTLAGTDGVDVATAELDPVGDAIDTSMSTKLPSE